jgi:hypothetical protein
MTSNTSWGPLPSYASSSRIRTETNRNPDNPVAWSSRRTPSWPAPGYLNRCPANRFTHPASPVSHHGWLVAVRDHAYSVVEPNSRREQREPRILGHRRTMSVAKIRPEWRRSMSLRLRVVAWNLAGVKLRRGVAERRRVGRVKKEREEGAGMSAGRNNSGHPHPVARYESPPWFLLAHRAAGQSFGQLCNGATTPDHTPSLDVEWRRNTVAMDLGSNGCGRIGSLKFQDLIRALDPSSGGPGCPVPLHATDLQKSPCDFSYSTRRPRGSRLSLV